MAKDEQFIFEFNEVDGPEKPALEPEDDSLLDLDDPAVSEEEEDASWAPVPPVVVEETVEAVKECAPVEVAVISPSPAIELPEPEPALEPKAEEIPAPVKIEEPAVQAEESVKEEPKSEVEPAAVAAAPVVEPVSEIAVVVEAVVETVAEAAPVEKVVEVEAEEVSEAPKLKSLKPADIRRAALAWMAKQKPSALAAKVPTRLKRFCASVAAFWSEPGRRKRLLKPQRTAIIEIRGDRESCFAESAKNADLLPAIRDAKAKKIELEAQIRINEPHLKDSDFLFDDIETWNYADTSNKEYHQVVKRIEELERALHKGSRFELIRRAKVANELYLAVPEGVLLPDELAEGWGLIYVTPELDAKLVKQAESWDCPEENMMHLAQNIGASALRDVLFSNGVHLAADGSISVIKPPRRRRPTK